MAETNSFRFQQSRPGSLIRVAVLLADKFFGERIFAVARHVSELIVSNGDVLDTHMI